MDTNKQFRNRLGELFGSQNLAALSTHHAGQPYASLVAFYAGDDLSADNRVAVMVNSSTNQVSDFHQAISVTAVGKAEEVVGADKEPILGQYLAKHPYLEDFVRSPTCALVRVSVDSYYLVKNFQNVMELHLEP